ncbi:MAG: VOC family protein [Planctomycetia bacterium]|nr:MAG: VOC family protein [Planctomycetia bacterium]
MLSLGDIQITVSDLERGLRFWATGLGLRVTAREQTPHSGFAVVEFEDGARLRLISPARAWEPGERPQPGDRPGLSFDVETSTFEDTLLRLLEHGGVQTGEVEAYEGMRIVPLEDPDGNPLDLIELPSGG